MSITSIDQTRKPALVPAEGLSETDAVKDASRDNAGLIRFLKEGDISDLVADNPPVGDMPVPKVPKQLGEVVSSASTTLNGMDTQDMTTDLYAIMALIFKVYTAERKNDFDVRQAGYQKQAKALYAASDEMRAAGQDRMWGAVVAGVAEIGGGLVTAGSGAYAGYQGMKGAGLQLDAAKAYKADNKGLFKELTARATGFTQSADSKREIGRGVSGLATGGGSLAKGIAENFATGRDAAKMDLEATGRTQEQMTQQVSERMSQLQDAMRDVLAKLSAIQQERQGINSGILRNL